MKDILTYPRISIAIINFDGKDYLGHCLDSIKGLDYPKDLLEVIIVDNGSRDGSVDFIKSEHPDVKLIKNNKNTGFAYANNQAAKAAGGEYIAFLNNDTKVEKKWLIELLKPIYGDREVVCSGSKVLSMDGKKIDFAGSMINFEGKGFQIDYGIPVEKDIRKHSRYLPFVNGGAMLINRAVFLDAGGFDEDFFAYYEDVDLGWRLWVLGYKVAFAPDSIVYHHHHGTSKRFTDDRLRFLKERNSLYSVFKNYDDDNLSRMFSGTLSNIFNRMFVDIKFDYKKYYDLSGTGPPGETTGGVNVSSQPLSSLMAARNFFDDLPKLIKKREKIQQKRKRDDKALFTYFKGQFLAVSPDKDYQEKQANILKSLGILKSFEKQITRKLVIISGEPISKEMAGPAIRVWNFAKILSQHMEVTVAVPGKIDFEEQDFKVVQFAENNSLGTIIDGADIILCGGMTFAKYPCIKDCGKFLIIDIYDPYILAALAEYDKEPIKKRLEIHKSIYDIFNEQFYYGDFFICASDRQRDFWLGILSALNRVNPYSYNQDPTLRKMIDVVPFGLPTSKPLHTKNVLKGKVKGINKNDFVVIWGGGIYNWFDPLTLIKAMAVVKKKRDDIKLFFMGVKHPNPEVSELQLVNSTVSLAKKLGLYEKNIFFNFGWVDYDQRQNYLLESDAGIITHPEHIETRFSFRTRIMDYLWTGLPVISTRGDHLSDLVERKGLGITTAGGDAEDVAAAILTLAGDKKMYKDSVKNISSIAGDYTWEKVCRPIISVCRDPVSYALKKKGNSSGNNGLDEAPPRGGKAYLIKRFFYHLFRSGPRKTSIFLSNYLKGK